MAGVVATRNHGIVTVRCIRCGDIGYITDRQYRRKQNAGTPHLCNLCRETKLISPRPAHYRYWLERFTIEEIKEIGMAIWG